MRVVPFALTLALCFSAAACVDPVKAASSMARPQPPIAIERQGSFTAGGTTLGDPVKASLRCDHGFVDYQIPVHARKTALFLWHSSSVQVWQQRWDGGEGYQSIFLRRGFPVYMWDGPRVGRGNMSCEARTYTPVVGQDQRNFIAWRFGSATGDWFPGVQFPKGDSEAFDQAMSARYEEFDIAKNAHLEAEVAAKALGRIGPSVLLTNSAGGWRAMLAALESDNVKGIVAYESAAFVFPDGEGPQDSEGGFGPTHVPLAKFVRLTRIPIQLVWGDNTEKTAWVRNVKLSRQFADSVNAHGGHAEVLMLPSVGLTGNTHIPFADLNNVQVADQLSLFLKKNKLDLR
ncbi:MAG: alpha/beta fold hydrolase [Gammaproteobacteria bacterium]